MYTWISASGGAVPPGAVPHGTDIDGKTKLYVCRAIHKDGLHPGKVGAAGNCAYISHLGEEVRADNYEVLMEAGTWAKASNGRIPVGAISCGNEANGDALFVARAASPEVDTSIQPGKVRAAFGGAYIPFRGREHLIKEYEVLMAK